MVFAGCLLVGHLHTIFFCKIKLMANKIPRSQNAFKLYFKYSYKSISKVSKISNTCGSKFFSEPKKSSESFEYRSFCTKVY